MFQFPRFALLKINPEALSLQLNRFPHSEIYGLNVPLQLPVAYRSLARPSSPLRA